MKYKKIETHMIDIIRGATESPVTTDSLINILESYGFEKAIFYSGYPIIGGLNDKTSIDGFLLAKDFGIIIFDLVEGDKYEDRGDFRDDAYNLVLSRLISNPKLIQKRGQLIYNPNVITYAPAWNEKHENAETIISEKKIVEFLNDIYKKDLNDDDFRKYLEAIQAVSKLKQKPLRAVSIENSKGFLLNKLEQSISNLDKTQNKAVIETTNRIQRIRGLAGSGKTIILALKVAYLHSKYPHWDIGVTYYTRSLKDQFKELITKFTIEQKREEPDWTKIKIMQAWGSLSEKGIYSEFCTSNNVEYLDFRTAKSRYSHKTDNLLGEICNIALNGVDKPKEIFDILLIDEAQDFSESFLKMCYSLIKSHDKENPANKRLVYAYDELQNLNKVTLKSPKEIFGDKIDFKIEKNKPLQDITLETCYRNSGRVLITAHALGFGIYKKDELVTMFEEKDIWYNIGYKLDSGVLEFGNNVVLTRDSDTSPEYYKDIASTDELIKFKRFENYEQEVKWIADEIEKNIKADELTHRDIIVIHPNALIAKDELGPIRNKLFFKGINNHLAGVSTSPDTFFMDESVAFTSIFRAKGNEAAMIYIVNADYCFAGPGLITKRNILFTAITRSKCWVRVCGIGDNMQGLINEYEKVKNNGFKLKFKYPTKEEMKHLNIIHRDINYDEEKKINESKSELSNLLTKLEDGSVKIEDLPAKKLELLKKLLNDTK